MQAARWRHAAARYPAAAAAAPPAAAPRLRPARRPLPAWQQPRLRPGQAALEPWRCRSSKEPCSGAGSAEPSTAAAAASRELFNGASTMEEVWDRLADQTLRQLELRSPGDRGPWLVGIAGVPGSGKSSTAKAVCARLNARGVPAATVPMDGFHFFRRQLDQMPDPALAHARRGAEWTFDARAYHACLAQIKATGEGEAPSFDHGVGDPVAADIRVERHHRVVLSEGNWLLLGAEPWWKLQELFDEAWYIQCDVDTAMQRVFERQTGNGLAADVSRWRIAANDRPNAEQIATTAGRATLLVPTLPLA